MKKRSVKIAGHPTSITLEDEFWLEFKAIALEQNTSTNQLLTILDQERDETTGLSTAVRLFVLNYLKQKIVKLT